MVGHMSKSYFIRLSNRRHYIHSFLNRIGSGTDISMDLLVGPGFKVLNHIFNI